jgi:hypothetical protein
MKTVLRLIVALPLVFLLVLILGSMLPPVSPEWRLADDIATCQYQAGIRRTTPQIYAITKDHPPSIAAYVQCMSNLGYSPVPAMP